MGQAALILSIGAINGAVLATLVGTLRANRAANRFLAAFIALVSLRLGIYILGFAGAYDDHPWITFLPLDMSLAFGPLIWLYVSTITKGAPSPGWRWHLVPGLGQFLYSLTCFALPLPLKRQWYGGGHLGWVEPVAMVLIIVSCSVYFYAAWRRYGAYQQWLDDHFGNREQWRLSWLRSLLVAFAATLILTILFALWNTFVTPLNYFGRLPLMLGFCGLTYSLGLLGWHHGAVAYPPETEHAAPSSDRDRTDYRALAAVWHRRTEEAEWWRDEALTLADLAQNLAVSERTLSRGLKEGAGENFNSFVNAFRVAAVQRAIKWDGYDGDLLTLALDCGFNSKASFNRAFKAVTGTTPSAWRRTSQMSPILKGASI